MNEDLKEYSKNYFEMMNEELNETFKHYFKENKIIAFIKYKIFRMKKVLLILNIDQNNSLKFEFKNKKAKEKFILENKGLLTEIIKRSANICLEEDIKKVIEAEDKKEQDQLTVITNIFKKYGILKEDKKDEQ